MSKISYRCPEGRAINGSSFRCDSCGTEFYSDSLGKPVFLRERDYSIVSSGDFESSSQSRVPRSKRGTLRRWLKGLLLGKNVVTGRQLRGIPIPDSQDAKILIIGGGGLGDGLGEFYSANRDKVSSIDIYDSPYVDYVMDAHELFFNDSQFDLVIIQAVLEHVFSPDTVVREINRVLRDGGFVYAEVPFLQNVHEGPYDFMRFTRGGIITLFRDLEVVSIGPVKGPGHSWAWSSRALLQPVVPNWLATFLTLPIFIAGRVVDIFLQQDRESDSSACYFYVGRKNEKHKPYNARQIVSMYP